MPDEERKKTRPQFVTDRNRSEWPLSHSWYTSTFDIILGIATHCASKPHGRCSSDFEDRFLHRFGSVHISRRSHCREQLEIKYSGGSYWKKEKEITTPSWALHTVRLHFFTKQTSSLNPVGTKPRGHMLLIASADRHKADNPYFPLAFWWKQHSSKATNMLYCQKEKNSWQRTKAGKIFVCLPDVIYTSLDSAECTQEKNERQGGSTVECPLCSSSSTLHLLSTQMQHKHTPKASVTPISLLITQEPDHFIRTS